MIQKTSLAIIVLLFALCGNVFAQKTRYLQVSTNPSTVDLYVGKVLPDFASKPDYTSPAFIPVPEGKDSVIVSFFHPDYADTTINIALAANDTSFIIVALRQTYADEIWGIVPIEVPEATITKEGHFVSTSNLVVLENKK